MIELLPKTRGPRSPLLITDCAMCQVFCAFLGKYGVARSSSPQVKTWGYDEKSPLKGLLLVWFKTFGTSQPGTPSVGFCHHSRKVLTYGDVYPSVFEYRTSLKTWGYDEKNPLKGLLALAHVGFFQFDWRAGS
jgi:hypothetical protein